MLTLIILLQYFISITITVTDFRIPERVWIISLELFSLRLFIFFLLDYYWSHSISIDLILILCCYASSLYLWSIIKWDGRLVLISHWRFILLLRLCLRRFVLKILLRPLLRRLIQGILLWLRSLLWLILYRYRNWCWCL